MKKRDNKPASLHHVLYEIEMLFNSVIKLSRSADPIDRNGWLEVFAIHARNLDEFFGEPTDRASYMRPFHFVSWSEKYEANSALIRRRNNQIAHLTYDREIPGEKTNWPVEDIFLALRPPCLTFLKAVVNDNALMEFQSNRTQTVNLIEVLPRIKFQKAI